MSLSFSLKFEGPILSGSGEQLRVNLVLNKINYIIG